jgi:hypothetical protein
MAAQLASEALGARQVIAKINDPLRASAYADLGIATLCRTVLMADAVTGYLGMPTTGTPGIQRPTTSHHDDAENGDGGPVTAAATTPAPREA